MLSSGKLLRAVRVQRQRLNATGMSASLLLVAVLLAACSSGRGPAPIQNRTSEPARPAEGVREPIIAPAPTPATPAIVESGSVQTTPVRPSGIESRPLDPKAAAGSTPATAAPPAPGVSSSGLGGLRTGPKGLKRPYTDAVLAELKAADSTATATLAKPDAAKPDAAKPDAPRADSAKLDPGKPDATKPEASGTKAEAEKASGTLDLAWPIKGKVLQAFAEPKQVGILLDGKTGDAVGAAGDGKVIFSGPGPRGYGNLVIVKHDVDTVTVYAHNKSLLVKEGQSVKRGQKIAEVGDTGADKVGLHFEVRRQGKPVDPQKLLPKR